MKALMLILKSIARPASMAAGFLFFIILALPYTSKGNDGFRVVRADGGLRMREQPSQMAKVTELIPDGSRVTLLGESDDEILLLGRRGKWVRVSWNNDTGWVFSGYLEVPEKKVPCDRWSNTITDYALDGYYAAEPGMKSGEKVRLYSIDMAFDNNDDTVWAAGSTGKGTWGRAGFFFKNMDSLEIHPGMGHGESFKTNNRVREAVLAIYKVKKSEVLLCSLRRQLGEVVRVDKLAFRDKSERQKFKIPVEESEAGYVGILQITGIYPGSDSAAKTCISTIRIKGKNSEEFGKDRLSFSGEINMDVLKSPSVKGVIPYRYLRLKFFIGEGFMGYGEISPMGGNTIKWELFVPIHALSAGDVKNLKQKVFRYELVHVNEYGDSRSLKIFE